MTKNEIKDELVKKGIAFNPKANKTELEALLLSITLDVSGNADADIDVPEESTLTIETEGNVSLANPNPDAELIVDANINLDDSNPAENLEVMELGAALEDEDLSTDSVEDEEEDVITKQGVVESQEVEIQPEVVSIRGNQYVARKAARKTMR